MNEKEAMTKFTNGERDSFYQEGKKDGYLKALEKTKLLEKAIAWALTEFDYQMCGMFDETNPQDIDARDKIIDKMKANLKQWEAEK